MVDLAAQIYRDFVVDGDPGSGSHKPVKSEIREWGTWVEGYLAGAFNVDVEIAKSTPKLILNKPASGTAASVIGQTADVARWTMELGSATGESGSDAGSNFNLYRHTDAGSPTIALSINRASGLATIGGALSLTAGQIAFPATQNPSADANTLDDYEEGTFTPTLTATGVTLSYASQVGTYTKIGNRVLFSIRIELNTSGNTLAANALSLAGFPFAAAAAPTVNVWQMAWSAATTSYIHVNCQLAAAATTATILGSTAAAVTNLTALVANGVLHATNGSALRVNGQYAV